jgi:hypothetical protein
MSSIMYDCDNDNDIFLTYMVLSLACFEFNDLNISHFYIDIKFISLYILVEGKSYMNWRFNDLFFYIV